MPEPSSIDRTDRKIMRLLQADGRLATVELAERIGLSPTATTERVKRLTREGFITGFGARLDAGKLDRAFLVFVEVLLDKTTPDVFDRFADAVRRTPDVAECHMVAGGFDYLLKVRVADMAAYRNFLGDALWTVPGVRETRTYTVMEEVKADQGLPV
ncbi:AsnC family transcriptional regulator [Labrys miyagiensis]|uniref:AsnC family transcriptional regulator n=1 Tax=Labrys miyagiensis TaxID=346912 RepID=A0ABQ6CNB6_9HYPH|nr:Lrp/AsnC ligand binding domain-containing protein [Labrys miyagiensis]GLS21843.1 AsnC family transcriptional regulator [Labrys miyagiensis]